MQSQLQPSLPALAKAGSEVAQTFFYRRRLANFGALGVGLLLLFISNPLVVYGLAVMALFIQGLAWWIRYEGDNYHRFSRELTKWGLLEDALGEPTDSLSVTDILCHLGKQLEQTAHQLDEKYQGKYYDSVQAPGNVRLLENLQESAFFSKHLYNTAAHRTLWLLVAICGIAILMVFFIIPAVSIDKAQLIPNLIVVFLTLVISDELSFIIAWRSAAICSEEVVQRLERVKNTNLSQTVLFAELGNYAAATVAAPPVPKHIFEAHREHLNQLWNNSRLSHS
jgi:hypothetical protein